MCSRPVRTTYQVLALKKKNLCNQKVKNVGKTFKIYGKNKTTQKNSYRNGTKHKAMRFVQEITLSNHRMDGWDRILGSGKLLLELKLPVEWQLMLWLSCASCNPTWFSWTMQTGQPGRTKLQESTLGATEIAWWLRCMLFLQDSEISSQPLHQSAYNFLDPGLLSQHIMCKYPQIHII